MILSYLMAFIVSIFAGFINTLAGSGSLIMLPVFLGMGLSSTLANGTNRVAVVFQSLIGMTTFLRNTKLEANHVGWSVLPCLLGSFGGAYLATQIDPSYLEQFIGVLLIAMLVLILVNPKRWLVKANSDGVKSRSFFSMFVMFVIGIYAGFIQAGVGIFLLAGLVLGVGYNLKSANAVKLIIVAAYAIPVLIIFAYHQQVDWFLGLFTSMGQGLGAYAGGLFATRYPKADVWVYRLLVLVVVVSIMYFYRPWEWL